MMNTISVYGKLEYVSMDCDGNIVLGISKKTMRDLALKMLKELENKEIYIECSEGRWALTDQ